MGWRTHKDNGNPCKDCQNRHVNCHSECSLYINWNQERQDFLKLQKEQKEITHTLEAGGARRVRELKTGKSAKGISKRHRKPQGGDV